MTTRAQPGVNLGGWLVLERWMTPSLFDGTAAANEYELWQEPDGPERISAHRDSFITEDDLHWLASVGIELVRLPVGYWALDDQPPYQSARHYIDWALDVAQQHGIQVLLDLHAAPGAQNANDHSGSGQPGPVGWYHKQHRRHTATLLEQLASRYGTHPAVWGIELLNEPLVQNLRHAWQLWWWSRQTSHRLRRILPPQVRIVVADCYNPAWWSGRIGHATLDIHHYQCFSAKDLAPTDYQYHADLLNQQQVPFQRYARQQPIIIGEWSATLPPNTMSVQHAQQFCQAQLTLPVGADAWFYWSYRTEQPGSWHFRDCYERGWFDNILTPSANVAPTLVGENSE